MKNKLCIVTVIFFMVSAGSVFASTESDINDLRKEVQSLKASQLKSNFTNSFKISGFGTVAYGVDENYSGYAGYGRDGTFEPESKFGLQMDFKINTKTSATIQFTANEKSDFNVEWAYIAHSFDNTLTVRAGKLRSPFFLVSDYLDVGYAQITVRPPNEVYDVFNMSNYTGIDLLYPIVLGDGELTLQPIFGSSTARANNIQGVDTKDAADVENMYGMAATYIYNDFTFRGSYFVTNIDNTNGTGKESADSPFLTYADSAFLIYGDASFMGLGFVYDNGAFIVQSEYTALNIDDKFPDTESAYIMLGYRINEFTPYLMGAMVDTSDDDERTGVIGAIASYERTALSGGVRWDFMANIALKLDVTYVDYKNTSGGYVSNVNFDNGFPEVNNDDTIVYTTTIDFVF